MRISLATRRIDAIYDIREGVRSASLNLYSRYGVQIQTPMVYGDDKVVVEVKIPEEIVDTFAIGPHLKGVATYLLKQCNGRYDNYLVGKRLLSYTEIAASDASGNKFRMEDRLEAVSKFAKLLERSDEEAIDHFNDVSKMVTLGSGANREVEDYMLTRYACYLIAENRDPRKDQITFAQSYFAVQNKKAGIDRRKNLIY